MKQIIFSLKSRFRNEFGMTKSVYNKGQVLLEAIVALSILVLILAAISIVVIVSVNNSSFIKNQNAANKYAQQGMEQLRSFKDSDLTEFNLFDGINNCMDENNALWDATECNDNPARRILDEHYIRVVNFEKLSPTCEVDGVPTQTKATVVVRWSSPKCTGGSLEQRYCHKAEVSSCFDAAIESL